MRHLAKWDWRSKTRDVLCGLVLPIALLGLWQWVTSTGRVPVTLAPEPVAVWKSFCVMVQDGSLREHIGASTVRLCAGFGIGTVLGSMMGVALATSKWMARFCIPTLSALAPVPPLAWGPLLIIWFGIGESSKIALIGVGTFFIVLTGVIAGIRVADRQLVEMAEALGKSRHALLFHVLLPSALPSTFTAMRVALGLSWTLLLGAEILNATRGIGWLLNDARNFSRPDDALVAMITIGVLGRLSDLFLQQLEKRSTSWRWNFNA